MIVIEAKSELITEPFQLKVTELTPHATITLVAQTTDANGQRWRSQAQFRSLPDGTVDLAKQLPMSGSYKDIDPAGLFWSMRPETNNQTETLFTLPNDENYKVHIGIYQNGKLVTQTAVSRKIRIDGVNKKNVKTENFQAEVYFPATTGPFPAVILAGDEQLSLQLQSAQAGILASQGYLVCIVNHESPQVTDEIALDPFIHAINWLTEQDFVQENKIALLGFAKNTEALLSAAVLSKSPAIAAVILISPSLLVWQNFHDLRRPAKKTPWRYQNNPSPFAKLSWRRLLLQIWRIRLLKALDLTKFTTRLICLRLKPAYANLKKAINRNPDAVIPSQRINAPLLCVAGRKDQVWPSLEMAEVIQLVRRKAGHENDQYYFYTDAGHVFSLPYCPTTINYMVSPHQDFGLHFGGKPKAQAKANQEMWQHILKFLQKHLTSD